MIKIKKQFEFYAMSCIICFISVCNSMWKKQIKHLSFSPNEFEKSGMINKLTLYYHYLKAQFYEIILQLSIAVVLAVELF